jgi:hypothetical protein
MLWDAGGPSPTTCDPSALKYSEKAEGDETYRHKRHQTSISSSNEIISHTELKVLNSD